MRSLDENCFGQFKVADRMMGTAMAQRLQRCFQASAADHAVAGNERRSIVARLSDQLAVEGSSGDLAVT